jgi:hypothetical protein
MVAMKVIFRNAFARQNAILLMLALWCAPVCAVSPVPGEPSQDSRTPVRLDLPTSVEMHERAGLIISGTFRGQAGTPSWIAKPSGEWVHVLLWDDAGKLLIDRRLWPYTPGRKTVVRTAVVYDRLTFPFEVLSRCEALSPGHYRLEVRYDSPSTDRVVAVTRTAELPLTVRSDEAVPLRHLSLEVPRRVVHDDFRVPRFGVAVRVLNDGCETQDVVPFAPEAVSVQAHTVDGRVVPCQPAVAPVTPPPLAVLPMHSWETFIAFSGRCAIPLPIRAGERISYRIQVSYQGPGWGGTSLRLDQTVDLELANLPHSAPGPPSPPEN